MPSVDDPILGIARIADYLGISQPHMATIFRFSEVPNAYRVERRGTPMWALAVEDADTIRQIRSVTPPYSPQRVAEEFVARYGFKYPAGNLDEGYEMDESEATPSYLMFIGATDIYEWCAALDEARVASHMGEPIYMVQSDLDEWVQSAHRNYRQKRKAMAARRAWLDDDPEEDDDYEADDTD